MSITTTLRQVPCPDAKAMVFDVEVLVPEGQFPIMATAVAEDAW